MNKNIKLGYLLIGLNNLFFWYAPWLLYLLKYLNLTEISTLLAIALASRVITEVPSGALSDLIGKKSTLLIAFFLQAVSVLMFAFFPTFSMLAIAFIISGIGASFYSGTMEAYMYDTLVGTKQESKYPKVLSHIGAISNAGIAIASVTGALLYRVWIGLPFVATSVALFLAFIITLFIAEPKVDTDKFSLVNFFRQTKKGFSHLSSHAMISFSALLLTFGIFQVIAYEVFDDVSVVAFGYNELGIGILYSVVVFLAIPFSFLYEKLAKKFKSYALLSVGIFLLALNYIASPWVNVYVWTMLFLFRVVYSPIRDGAISEMINTHTPSRIRATTISTYELVRKIPFVILGASIGVSMDKIGVKITSAWFMLAMLILTIPQIALIYRKIGAKKS